MITVIAIDDPGQGGPNLTGTKTFTVVVNEVNDAPVLPVQPDRTITGFATLVVTNRASDSDLPANDLTYQLINAPAGAAIDTNGVITWTPIQGQVSSSNLIQTVVADYNSSAVNTQQLFVTNSFIVMVAGVNDAPPPSLESRMALTVLVSFDGTNGANPLAGLAQGTDGNLYGATSSGGVNHLGTLFQMTPSGAIHPLVSFNLANGANPSGRLAQGEDRNFYGTTTVGGASGGGTAFKVTTNGILTTLVSFNFINGLWPGAGLARGRDGKFYGTTSSGGDSGMGTAFPMTTNGIGTAVYSFSGGTDGANPSADLVQASDGNFYGTTSHGGANGCGGVFKFSASGLVTTLYSFNCGSGGSSPRAGLVQGTDGKLYGTTLYGGNSDSGIVFRLTTDGALTSLVSFNGTNGASPRAGLIQARDGNFYGTTKSGGDYPNYGTIFQMAPDGKLRTLVSFNGTNGANPQAALLEASDGSFYGTTAYGGAFNQGMVFRLSFVTAPIIQATTRTNGQFTFTWNASAGQTYQAQYKTSLDETNWTSLGSPLTATDVTATASDLMGPDPQRFYRVVLLP
jgi:uncharacterized repeat protein (TIGR03803 family)